MAPLIIIILQLTLNEKHNKTQSDLDDTKSDLALKCEEGHMFLRINMAQAEENN